jgi:hypothetical protein
MGMLQVGLLTSARIYSGLVFMQVQALVMQCFGDILSRALAGVDVAGLQQLI